MELLIRIAERSVPSARRIEVVERKGLGHPDTLCDGIAEEISRSLCQHYLEAFGMILHHNVDKVLLVGGSARARYGGGEVTEPIEIYLAGRATAEFQGKRIPVDEIAVEACRRWLKQQLRYVDVDRRVRIVPRIRPGSHDLTGLFERDRRRPLANDTSCGVGFAPLSELERVVLTAEKSLNSPDVKRAHPEIGEDIKVMGIRRDERIVLTVGCAFVARHVGNVEAYEQAKQRTCELIAAAARTESSMELEVVINAADDVSHGEVFLTVTGTSAEAGDDGEVGRGNRASGLITPYRPMTMEAVAGKNPVTHVGKIYNVAATRIAQALAAALPHARDVCCVLVSQIGRPVDDPHVAEIAVEFGAALDVEDVRGAVERMVGDQLARLPEICDDLIAGKLDVF